MGVVDRRVIAAAVAVPLFIAGGVVAVALAGDDGSTTTALSSTTTVSSPETDSELARLLDDLGPTLADAVGRLVELANDAASTTSPADTAFRFDAVDDLLARVAAGADEATAWLTRADPAAPLLFRSIELYQGAAAAQRSAVLAPDGTPPEVVEQLDRLARRLRILGDRVFDRLRAAMGETVGEVPGVDTRPSAEVPDWISLELAAGPPLEPTEPVVAGEPPPTRRAERPSQPEAAWRTALVVLDVPSAEDVREGDSADLARRLVAAAEALRDTPVPDGDRERADRLALGWLIRADAARAAQLAALDPVAAVSVLGADSMPLAEWLLAISADPALGADPLSG